MKKSEKVCKGCGFRLYWDTTYPWVENRDARGVVIHRLCGTCARSLGRL